MRNYKRLVAVLLTLALAVGMFCSMALVVSAETTAAESAGSDNPWLLPGILLAVLDVELLAIVVLGILIGLKKRRGHDKLSVVAFPVALIAVTQVPTVILPIIFGVLIVIAAFVIVERVMTLVTMKNAPAEEASVAAPAPAPAPIVEEAVLIEEDVDEAAVAEAMAAPTIVLEAIAYDDLVEVEKEDGVEVISVVWPERKDHNKLYRYSPNGEKLVPGDVVLVPTHDVKSNRHIFRKAAVVRGNHFVDPDTLHHKLKKIVARVKIV